MKKNLILILLMFAAGIVRSQNISLSSVIFPDSLKPVNSMPLFGDSLVKSFVIDIRKEVKLHKHETHSEHVYVVEGAAMMTLGKKTFSIQSGDVVFIPKGTPHKVVVMGSKPLRVISIQAPDFDGKDRVMLE